MSGIMDAFAKSISYGLQYGVPLRAYVEAFVNSKFEPAGMTDDPDLRIASSIMDYLFRRMALDYMSYDERAEPQHLQRRRAHPAHAAGCRRGGRRDEHRLGDRPRPEERAVGRRAGDGPRVGFARSRRWRTTPRPAG